MSLIQRCVISVWGSFHPIDFQISLDSGTSGRREGGEWADIEAESYVNQGFGYKNYVGQA